MQAWFIHDTFMMHFRDKLWQCIIFSFIFQNRSFDFQWILLTIKAGQMYLTSRLYNSWKSNLIRLQSLFLLVSILLLHRTSVASSPCIMCVQYRGGAQYCGGVQYRGRISWAPWGDILSTVGGVQYRGGISWVPWEVILSTVGDIMMHVGDILSTVGVFSTVGGYHPLKFEYHGGYHDACGGISWVPWGVFSTVGYSNNKRLFPPRYWTPSTVLMISPHLHHDIPHGTEHPPRYSR